MFDLPIYFSPHSLMQLADRGTTQEEVELTIREGGQQPAKGGRWAFRKNFSFESEWKGQYYRIKQVMPIVALEHARLVVVTVYVFFFGGEE